MHNNFDVDPTPTKKMCPKIENHPQCALYDPTGATWPFCHSIRRQKPTILGSHPLSYNFLATRRITSRRSLHASFADFQITNKVTAIYIRQTLAYYTHSINSHFPLTLHKDTCDLWAFYFAIWSMWQKVAILNIRPKWER